MKKIMSCRPAQELNIILTGMFDLSFFFFHKVKLQMYPTLRDVLSAAVSDDKRYDSVRLRLCLLGLQSGGLEH